MTGVGLDPVKPVPDAALHEDALRRAVLAALANHPAEAAVTEGHNERDSAVWGMEVETAEPAAASVYVTFTGGDEVVVGSGQTHAYIWDDDPTALAAYLRAVLDAVFAGDFEEAGLGDAVRIHDLRHAAASFLLLQGVDMRVVTGTLGHSRLTTTSDLYTHLLEPGAACSSRPDGRPPSASQTGLQSLITAVAAPVAVRDTKKGPGRPLGPATMCALGRVRTCNLLIRSRPSDVPNRTAGCRKVLLSRGSGAGTAPGVTPVDAGGHAVGDHPVTTPSPR